ncbi:MAG: presenilin family intramembrane aspartyl protease [Candidatus Woesearchaeota archaeon]
MKHNLKITALVILFFLLSQAIGLGVLMKYVDYKKTKETGQISWKDLPYEIERPKVQESTSFIYIFAAIIIGTILLLGLIRTRVKFFWKLWFFLAVMSCLAISFSAFIPAGIAFLLATMLAFWKIIKPNFYVHNLTELFIYGGIAAVFVPVMNVFSASLLLIIISIYDFIAVYKIKHMVTLAKFQSSENVFAGLYMPYSKKESKLITSLKRRHGLEDKSFETRKEKENENRKSNLKARTRNDFEIAILGGGDIALPLIFTGVILKTYGLLSSFTIILFSTLALTYLLFKSEKKKFYPAMPFITTGCFIGYISILLLKNLFIALI